MRSLVSYMYHLCIATLYTYMKWPRNRLIHSIYKVAALMNDPYHLLCTPTLGWATGLPVDPSLPASVPESFLSFFPSADVRMHGTLG